MEITIKEVGEFKGSPVKKVTLTNDNQVSISLLSSGATWQEFLVPDEKKGGQNLIIGFDDPMDYYRNPLCACQSIGRVAGRIDQGSFRIKEKVYQVPQNEKGNCLHGGPNGFNQYNWEVTTQENSDVVSVTFEKTIKESIDGFPGDMRVRVTYSLTNDDTVSVTYQADEVTKDTLFNPTNHVYFNLGDKQDLSSHYLTLKANNYLETREDLIPTGKVLPVEGTFYDFREEKNLKEAIGLNDGFDDAFVVEGGDIATLRDAESGHSVTLSSNRTGLVMYTMNEIPSGIYFSKDSGKEAQACQAVALEAQDLPDAINHDGFGNIVLEAGQMVSHTISYHYSKKIVKF